MSRTELAERTRIAPSAQRAGTGAAPTTDARAAVNVTTDVTMVVTTDELAEAMWDIYETYAGALRRFLMRLTAGEREFAEDLLQETLLRAWRHVDALPSGLELGQPWLFTVARHAFIDATRKRKVRAERSAVVEAPVHTDTPDHAQRVVDVHTVRSALARLNEVQREVLIELYYRDVTPRELATRLGVPEGTVRSRRFYALRSLAEILGPVG